MEVDQTRILLIDDRDTLSSATLTPSFFVQLSILFSIPQHLSSPILISSLTAKRKRVRSIDPFTGAMFFTRPLNV